MRTYDLVKFSEIDMWARKNDDFISMDHALIEEHFVDNTFAQCVFDLPKDSYVLDAGAHIGTYCIRIHKDRKDLKFLAMEPIPENYGMLVKNLIHNNINSIYPVQFALSPVRGYLLLKNYGNEGAWSGVPQGTPYRGETPVLGVTLTDALTKVPFDHVDFIKMDIEGMEWVVLKTLDLSNVQGLDLELHKTDDSKLTEYLKSQGFKINVYKHQGIEAYK